MKPHLRSGAGRATGARSRPRVAIIGAGIVGLAHAWAAARRGWQVLLFERNHRAQGASIRNFGMVWPIGQPNGPQHRTALRSRELWVELLKEARWWSQPCGSFHLAYRDDELAVLEEFARLAPSLGYDCELLSPPRRARRSRAAQTARPAGRPVERDGDVRRPARDHRSDAGVAPRRYGVELHFDTPIELRRAPRGGRPPTTNGGSSTRVVVATGADLRLLYPDLYVNAGFRRCKLQMLRTVPQPAGWIMGPMLAGGLTLRHYAAFGVCKSLAALKQRIAEETPELNHFGIHVMASQNGRGEVILGDSHEYGDDIAPFDKSASTS